MIPSLVTIFLLAAGASSNVLGAGSVAYLKAGDVWVTNLDGSATKQITTDGPAKNLWTAVGNSDVGTVVANAGEFFSYFDYTGRRIGGPYAQGGSASIDTQAAETRFEPGGGLIAFTYGAIAFGASPELRVKVGNRTINSGGSALPEYDGFREPAWIGGTQTLALVSTDVISFPDAQGNLVPESYLYLQGPAGPSFWFKVTGVANIDNIDITRDARRLLISYQEAAGGPVKLALFTLANPISAMPSSLDCDIAAPPDHASARFSADGTQILWQDGAGIYISPLPGASCTLTPRLLVPGGTQPSPGAQSLPSGGGGGGGGVVGVGGKPKATKFVNRISTRGLVSFTFRLSEPATVKGTLLKRNARGTFVPRSSVRARALKAGPGSVRLGTLPVGVYRLRLSLTDSDRLVTNVVRRIVVPKRTALRSCPPACSGGGTP